LKELYKVLVINGEDKQVPPENTTGPTGPTQQGEAVHAGGGESFCGGLRHPTADLSLGSLLLAQSQDPGCHAEIVKTHQESSTHVCGAPLQQ